jgi:RHS repeat-associated protein
MTRPNGIATNYTYDSLSRLLSVLHQAGGSTIDGAVYTLDPVGNRSTKQDDLAGVTTSYGYDKLYELLSATQGGTTTESYTYDPVGNRTASLAIPSYTVNTSNELTSDSSASYTYDQNGNTTSKTDSTGTTNYTWDFENRLKQVTLPSTGGTVAFLYDPFGRRIQKALTQNGTTTTTNYAYDGDNVVETADQNGNVLARFNQGQNIDEPLAESTSSGIDYYEQDGLGSVTSLTNDAGQLAQTYTYDSFGTTTNASGSVANPFRYIGREFESEIDLYYDRARFYDPISGRFVSSDPGGFAGGINAYAYVKNRVTRLVDTDGFKPSCSPLGDPLQITPWWYTYGPQAPDPDSGWNLTNVRITGGAEFGSLAFQCTWKRPGHRSYTRSALFLVELGCHDPECKGSQMGPWGPIPNSDTIQFKVEKITQSGEYEEPYTAYTGGFGPTVDWDAWFERQCLLMGPP